MPVTNFENSFDFNGQKFYVGLDVHKKSWAVTVRSLGRQVAHFTQPPGAQTLARSSGCSDRASGSANKTPSPTAFREPKLNT